VAPETPPTLAVPTAATEYTIVKGDTFERIAKNSHVSIKAIADANPGIEPTKLKIGQKIHIPSPSTLAVPTVAGAAPNEATSVSGEHIYTVKSGDNLTKIAAQHGVTVKALRAANGLKTDSIKVGQKLKVPAKGLAPAPVPAPGVESEPMTPTVPPPSTPGQ